MTIPKSDVEVNGENLPGAFKATVKQGYWEDMTSFDPEASIRVNYMYDMNGIVRALSGNSLQGISPDDAGHSPVSDKWELYVISVSETYAPVLRGDVNVDGEVDINDVTALIDYLLGLSPQPFNLANADVEVDGQVDINDVTTLIDILLGLAR